MDNLRLRMPCLVRRWGYLHKNPLLGCHHQHRLVSLKTLTEGDDTLTANKDGTNNIQALAGDDTITGGISHLLLG
jgi:hypothetical protein